MLKRQRFLIFFLEDGGIQTNKNRDVKPFRLGIGYDLLQFPNWFRKCGSRQLVKVCSINYVEAFFDF